MCQSSLSVAVKMLHESQNTDEQKTRHSCHDLKQHHTLLQWRDCSPIGSVEVSIICSSSGVMRASCSSEGDQLLYSWTLNGDSLMDGNGSIDLNEGTDGNITCSVKNHVSHGQKTINVKPCVGEL
ncbi:hepatocyte cell adhesion molecule-like protein [Labeo rohita]|uniref:Hepatocyte cell adhesion molecule-like protein n=1 Tax=Labeo rohita TaxID=84645 RepID=A0A498NV72_LABRO|nr:hepatocyte cell adhesion molecule-like protein [Labeo rohita]